MPVIMTFRVQGDPTRLEETAAANPERMSSIAERAIEYGLIAHRVYGSDDGQVMVVDEWPDAASFHRFYGEMQSQIEPLMRDTGIGGDPEITFWRKLETHDDVGWGA